MEPTDLPSTATTPPELEIPYSSLQFRRHQMFPRLSVQEIESLRRFATSISFKAGEFLVETGQVARGLFLILSGRVRVCSRDRLGHSTLIIEHESGDFIAEMAQLSGRPALVDGVALTDVEALVIDPGKLRALIVADAQLGERIMRALILRRLGLIEKGLGPVIVGNGEDGKLIRLQGFLRRNAYPATIIDARTDPEAIALLEGMTTGPDDFPLVFCPNGDVLRAPDESQLASSLGFVPTFDPSHVYDVAIVGAGPAGLAAAVYAATEGLSVVVFDQRAPGGQAGTSARIENYLGFPTGISGQALAARAYQQALKFGAHVAIPGVVTRVQRQKNRLFILSLKDGQGISARTVVVASGAAYRKPMVKGFERFEGRGIYYWASPIEGRLVKGRDIVLMGGGNSAGQAIVFLANFARSIRVVIRAEDLHASMSRYLIERIGSLSNVALCARCTLRTLAGNDTGLTQIELRHEEENVIEVVSTRHLFMFIGADPKTDWLASSGVELDKRGFVVTGQARLTPGRFEAEEPYALETNLAGMFAAGDVRAKSAKRVAAAVGDGAAVVAQIHAYLSRSSTVPV
ncbi:thioredoxin reductase (NADPH) [Paraburkholderia sp. GAS199]|uniref:FAD-dependent oxidoreductase n=1 Tax=Paraburkholderia sp. GAS199 TaxID=3035126 RepID=UPI003D2237C7